jgi:predicted nucleic acid-binding protein
MKLLLDTNVVLDVLLGRKSYLETSAFVWAAVERGGIDGLLSAHAVTTIHYLVSKEHGSGVANRATISLLKVFGVASVTREVIDQALALAWPDFEDAVTAAAARSASCDGIVTRDPKGFRRAPVRIFTPQAAAALIRAMS